ncbi:MAG: hypothetical protein MJA30_17190 [Cytophagales bacterium]|nr:hypothetical protein [Cytophagales bacterium]
MTRHKNNTELLPIDKLKFLQDLVDNQLSWIDAPALKKQLWELLVLAVRPNPGMACKMTPEKVSDLAYMYARLAELFDRLDSLRPYFNSMDRGNEGS